MYATTILKSLSAVAFAMALTACGGGTPAPTAPTTPAAPATAATLKLYGQTCQTCHGVSGTGAPKTGDVKAWSGRLYKGRETLLNNSINGYRSMPPMGGCMQCTEEDFAALIEYMSGSQLK